MAIIYSYPTVSPTTDDLILGTDVNQADKPTKNFTIQSIVDLVTGTAAGLGATLTLGDDARVINPDGSFGANQSAVNFLNLTGSGSVTFGSFLTTAGAIINGTIGTGFTAFTSTIITGTLQTAAQPNITSLGTLTALDVDGLISGNAVETTLQSFNFATDTNIASTLNIKNYILTNPPGAESLAATLLVGDTTGATDINISSTANINFLWNNAGSVGGKLYFGGATSVATQPQQLQIYAEGFDSFIKHTGSKTTNGSVGLSLESDDAIHLGTIAASLPFIKAGRALNTLSGDRTVELYHWANNNSGGKKFETTGAGVITTGTTTSTGVFQGPNGSTTLPTYGFTGDVNTGMYGNGNGEVKLTSNGNTHYTFANAGATFTDGATPPGLFLQSDTFTTTSTTGLGKITRFVLSTDFTSPQTTAIQEFPLDTMVPTNLAVKLYADEIAGAKTLSYKDTSATVNTMNLTADDIQFTGGSNITSTATAVALNIADIKFDLDNSVTITGTMQAGTLSDGTFSGTAGTYTGGVSITSTDFVGALTGNASTATALAAAGTMSIDGDFTTTVAPTYTSGGNQTITANIADTVVTGKVLTNLTTPTSVAISAGDTILAAMAKLQGQITGLAGSLAFEGTWDASAGTAPSATPLNGQFWIVSVAGSTNLSGITDWLVGDWAIYVNNGAGTDAWQKLDQSNEVLGSGTAQKMAMWSGTVGDASQTLATGLIEQDSTNTLITIGNSGSLFVEGNTTLGNAVTDTVTATGPVTLNKNLILEKGLALDSTTTVPYGVAGDVLTSGGGIGAANTWTTPTVGTLTGLTAGAGITTQLNADADNVTVSVDYLGTDNVILEATQITAGAAIPSSAEIMFNDPSNAVANTVLYAPISSLPFVPAVSGTQYTLPMFATTSTLGNSMFSQNAGGTQGTISGAVKIEGDLDMDSYKIEEVDELKFTNNKYIYGTGSAVKVEGEFRVSDESTFSNLVTLDLINNATTDTDKFLVSDSGEIKYRTGAEVLSDIGAAPVTGGSYLPLAGGTLTGPLTGTDATFSGNVSLADDKSLTLGTGVDSKIFFDNAASVLADSTVIQSTPTSGTGTILLQSYNVKMRDQLGTSNMFHATRYGVTLYYDGDVKFTTTSSGVNLNGFGSGTKTGTAAYNLGVDSAGDVIETNANPGGSGGGIFSGDQAIAFPPPSVGDKAFTLNRATTGTLIFDVWFTSETSIDTSVAKKYTVAHANNGTPVYNKIIDTGPKSTGYANNDFTVSFVNAGSGLSVECYIVAGSIAQNIGYTVQVGHDSTNALTFTPAS